MSRILIIGSCRECKHFYCGLDGDQCSELDKYLNHETGRGVDPLCPLPTAANTGCADPAPEPDTQICPKCKSIHLPKEIESGKCWDCGEYINTGKLRTAR